MKLLAFYLASLMGSPFCLAASPFDSHIRGSNPGSFSYQQIPLDLTTGTFQQAIDHFAQATKKTFAQRYWVESAYATSGNNAPVIYHICGEGDVDQSYFLSDNAIAWAQTLGAHIVYLEHRYYGQSLPFPDLSTDHLQFLTLNNVLEDLGDFQKWLTTKMGWTGKWISIGGSYSGTLSALYRQAHPELVIGALASSAPMVSGVGQPDYDDSGDLSNTDPSGDTGARQWAYQACTTFGFWLADGPSFGSVLDFPSTKLCQQIFPNAPAVNSSLYNQDYDLPFLSNVAGSPSNILFTYGSDDVWTQIGLSQQANSNPNIAIDVIAGAGHHFDLNAPDPSDTQAVLAARAAFVTLAKQWLSQ